MSISLTPLEDKIIVKQAEAETQTASGLFIPDNAKEKPQQGEVLAVGPGRRNDAGERIPVDVKVDVEEIKAPELAPRKNQIFEEGDIDAFVAAVAEALK